MNAPDYKQLHPNAPQSKVSLEKEHLRLVNESDDEQDTDASSFEVEGDKSIQKEKSTPDRRIEPR